MLARINSQDRCSKYSQCKEGNGPKDSDLPILDFWISRWALAHGFPGITGR